MMFILKHSKSSDKFPDQTTMTVISNLNKKEGYTPQDVALGRLAEGTNN